MHERMQKKCDQPNACANCRAGRSNGLAQVETELLLPFQEAAQNRHLQRHELLLKTSNGRVWDQVYCVNKGLLKLARRDADGNETILRLYSSGGLIGLPAVVGRSEAFNEQEETVLVVEALIESDLCVLPSREIEHLIFKDSGFCRRILSDFATEILDDRARIAALAAKPVRARIAGLLLEMASEYGQPMDSTVRLGNLLSRQEIASLAGTALETAVRALQSLRKDKLLALDGREIVLLDLKGLRQAAA